MTNGERGQVLPLVLIAVTIGALVITPFLGHADTSLIGSRVYGREINEQYSRDSGIEHAIWNLTDGGLADQLSSPGASTSYQLAESINGLVPSVTVSNAWETIASDNFESATWSGGSGWLTDWSPQGDASIVTTGTPYQGSYHLRLRDNTGYVNRTVDLSAQTSARLQFWAKVNSFEGGETAQCLVSSNGTSWTAVRTWTIADDDNTYHFYDIDLSSYTLSSQFWIAFQANMSGTGDYFYVDDLKLVWQFNMAPTIASDDYESATWSGGSGWLTDWSPLGDASIVTTGVPNQGSYHLRLRRNTGYVNRSVDLSAQTFARLQFWAKVNSFEAGETAQCLVSENGTSWTAVRTWTTADDDNTYHFDDIDLSSYALSSQFWIAFQANMSGTGDYFYVDSLAIVGDVQYGITSEAGDGITKAVVRIAGGDASLLLWWVK